MRERVTVAVDGGPASGAAVRWVVHRAASVALDVRVLTVADMDWVIPEPMDVESGDRYRAVLDSAAATLAASAGDTPVHQELLNGYPAAELIAASEEADLLVLGTNKAGPITGLVHGTIPLRVAGRARCVTVVVPVTWQPNGSGVVVGWTGDSTSDVALEFAAREAGTRGCPLTIVRAATVPPRIVADSRVVADTADTVVEKQRRQLAETAERLRAGHPGLDVIDLLAVKPAGAAIVDAARDAELVVVGSHARGVLGGLVLGSVSHDVLLNMPAPVAVVPHPEEPIIVTPETVDEVAL